MNARREFALENSEVKASNEFSATQQCWKIFTKQSGKGRWVYTSAVVHWFIYGHMTGLKFCKEHTGPQFKAREKARQQAGNVCVAPKTVDFIF